MQWKNVLALGLMAGLLFAFSLVGQAGGLKSESQVKVTATSDKPDSSGKQKVTVHLDINKGWHIYANPVKNKDLEETQTEVVISSEKKLSNVKINYPSGHEVKDKLLGDHFTYEGRIVITGVVVRESGDNGPLSVKVTFQACNDKKCLAQSTVRLSVP